MTCKVWMCVCVHVHASLKFGLSTVLAWNCQEPNCVDRGFCPILCLGHNWIFETGEGLLAHRITTLVFSSLMCRDNKDRVRHEDSWFVVSLSFIYCGHLFWWRASYIPFWYVEGSLRRSAKRAPSILSLLLLMRWQDKYLFKPSGLAFSVLIMR